MKFANKLLCCVILVMSVTACLDGNRVGGKQSETNDLNHSAKNDEDIGKGVTQYVERKPAVIPPSPETLTVGISRTRQNKVEPVADTEIFQKNDGVRLKISAVESGFVTVLYKGSDNNYVKLFPNKAYNDGKNSVSPNQLLQIPDRGWLFFDEKKGVETIFVVYSKTAIPKDLTGEAKDGFAVLEKLRSENNDSNAFATSDGNLVRIVKLTHE